MSKIIDKSKAVVQVRFSYAHVFEPKAINEGDTPKYSVSCIIPKSDTATIKAIEDAIENAKVEGKAKFGGKIPAKIKTPLRDGDEERPEDDAYRACYFLNANSTQAPDVIDKHRQPIIDPNDFYSGCYGYVSLKFYAFNTSGNKGIACGLNNIMKTKDGEALGGVRSSAEDDFAGISVEDVDDDFLD